MTSTSPAPIQRDRVIERDDKLVVGVDAAPRSIIETKDEVNQ